MIIQGDTTIVNTKDIYSINKAVSYNQGYAAYLIEVHLNQNPNEECLLGIWSTKEERDEIFENLAFSWSRDEEYFKV